MRALKKNERYYRNSRIYSQKENNKGKIEIEYYSRDDLDRIIDLFESIG